MEKYKSYPAVLKKWNEEAHGTDPQELVTYVYKFLIAAYKRDIPISFKSLFNTRESEICTTSDEKIYDMYEFEVRLIDDSSYYRYWDKIKFVIRSCKKVNSTRNMIAGVYHLYLGCPWHACMDLNCSYFDISDEYQMKNLDYRLAVKWLVEKILSNNILNTWLILQGINVRNVL